MTGKRAASIVALKIKKYGTDVTRTRGGFASGDVTVTLRCMVLPIEPEQIEKLQSEAGANVNAATARNFVIKAADDVVVSDVITVVAKTLGEIITTETYRIAAVTPIVMQNTVVFYNAVGTREA